MTTTIDGTPRRALLGVAVATGALCAGCGSNASTAKSSPSAPPNPAANSATTPADPPSTTDSASSSPSTTAGASGAAPVVLSTTDHVPVGGGIILADRQIVLAQPTAGVIKAFTAVCTHAGCTVASVEANLIICPCHGSRFHLADGSVANGPAAAPLAAVPVTVSGKQIVLQS